MGYQCQKNACILPSLWITRAVCFKTCLYSNYLKNENNLQITKRRQYKVYLFHQVNSILLLNTVKLISPRDLYRTCGIYSIVACPVP